MAGVQGQTLKPTGVQGQKLVPANQEVDSDFWGPTLGSIIGGTAGAIGGFAVGGPFGAYAGGVAGSGAGASAGKAFEDYFFDDQTPTDVVKTGVIDAGFSAVAGPALKVVGKVASRFGLNPTDLIPAGLPEKLAELSKKLGKKADSLDAQVVEITKKLTASDASAETLQEVSDDLHRLMTTNADDVGVLSDFLDDAGVKISDLSSDQFFNLLSTESYEGLTKKALTDAVEETPGLLDKFTKPGLKPIVTKPGNAGDNIGTIQGKISNEIKDVDKARKGLLQEQSSIIADKNLTTSKRRAASLASNAVGGGPTGLLQGTLGSIPSATGASSTIRPVNNKSTSTAGTTNAEIEAYLVKTYGKEQAAKIMQQKAQRGGNLISADQGFNKGGKALSNKVGLLRREGYPQDQAVAIAHSYRKRGMLK